MLTRITAAALALVLASASTAAAQDDNAEIIVDGNGDAVVVPLNSSIAPVAPGDTQWVALNWTSLNAEARNLKVTATGSDGVLVEYPEFSITEDRTDHTSNGYSSGFADSILSESEIDYTALKVTVDSDIDEPMFVTLTVSYDSDTGSHVNQHQLPIDDDGDDTGTTTTTVAPTTTTTAAPTTAAPTTAAPTTAAPTTAAPTTAAPTTAAPTTTAAPLPEVVQFFLVDAAKDEVVREIFDGEEISKREYRKFTIEAITDGPAESVKFTVDGRTQRVESVVPYLIASDWYGDFHPWNVNTGTYVIEATPFTQDSAQGSQGKAKSITIKVVR